jgi:hypothetical protein
MMANVIKAFDEYPADKLEDKGACYYYNKAHNEGKRCRRETGTSVDLSINLLDDYDRYLAYIAE